MTETADPILLVSNDGSIAIGLVDPEMRNIADDECVISINERRFTGISNERTIFSFDLSQDAHLENMVGFAMSDDVPMINIWEADDEGMIPFTNIKFAR